MRTKSAGRPALFAQMPGRMLACAHAAWRGLRGIPGRRATPEIRVNAIPSADLPAHDTLRAYLRAGLGAFAAVLVLLVYSQTNDPAGDIKRLWTAWSAFGLGLGWLVCAWRFGLPARRLPLFGALLTVFLALYFIAVLRSPFPWLSLVAWSEFFFLAAICFVAAQAFTHVAQVQRFFVVLCTAVAVASLYGFLQKAGLDPFPWDERDTDVYLNLPATFGNPNFAAHTLVLTIPLAIYLAVSGRAWCLGLAAIHLAHLYYTGQRAGIIALAAAALLVAVAWVVGRRIPRPLPAAVVSLALVVLAGLLGALGAMGLTRLMTQTPIPLETSLLIRYQSYVSATDMFRDAPLGGWGPGVYDRAYPAYWTPFEQQWFAQELRKNAHVHNDVMELAVDAGLPAAGIYATILIVAMLAALQLAFVSGADAARRRMAYALAAVFLAFLIDGFFGFNLRVPVSAGVLFLLLGLLDGLYADPARGSALRGPALAVAGLVVAALLGAALLGARVFASEYALLQGMVLERQAARALEQGQRQAGLARVADAEAQFARGESLAPWNDRFGWWLGRLALAKGETDAAIAHLDRALAKNPHAILTHLPMAQAKLQRAQRQMRADRGDVETALAMLDDAAGHAHALLETCPDFGRAEGTLGQISAIAAIYLTATGDPAHADRAETYWEAAEGHLEQALRHGVAGESSLYAMLAKVRLARGKPLQAEAALVRAALADPADIEVWSLFIDFANSNRRFDRIRNTLYAQIRAMEEANPPKPDVLASTHLWLANVLENGYQDWEGVDAAYLKAVEHGPLRPEIWTNFARYAQERGRVALLKQAVAQSTARVQLAGEKPLPHLSALNTVLQFGARALDDASAVLVEQARGHAAADGMTAAQAYGWTARLMLEALPMIPGGPEQPCEAYMNLGIALAAMRDVGMAERLFASAETCLPATGLAFLAVHQADLRARRGDIAGAIEILERGRANDPENLDVRWALARSLHRAGRSAEALAEYGALLDIPGVDAKAREVLAAERDAVQAAATADAP